jgi:hypothetical protein
MYVVTVEKQHIKHIRIRESDQGVDVGKSEMKWEL